MPSGDYLLVREAIENKLQVIAVYGGHERVACPHVIGYKNGKEHVLFWQFGGSSSSAGEIKPGVNDEWRCMEVSQMSDVTVQDGEWHTGGSHSQPNTCVDEVDVEVDY